MVVQGVWWRWGQHSRQGRILQTVPRCQEINTPSILSAGAGALIPAGWQELLLGRWEGLGTAKCH